MEYPEWVTLHFYRYIAQGVTTSSWVCNPFGTDVRDLANNISSVATLQERLSQVLNDKRARYNFEQQT
jgi:hypothetical protein